MKPGQSPTIEVPVRLLHSVLFLILAMAPALFPEPPVLPPPGHPRLFLRTADLPEMRRRMTDAFYSRAWNRVLAQGSNTFSGTLTPGPSNYDPRIHDGIEAGALRYLLEGHAPSGEKALAALRRVLPVVTYPERQDITREKGATILTAAMVYDWCFPLLTADDKAMIIMHMKRIAGLMEVGYPPVKQGNLVGHAGEAQIFRDQLAGGIATYDEDPEMYRHAASRLFGELIPARNFFSPSGWHHQGSSYGPYRYQWEITAAWILRRMTGGHFFDDSLGQVPYGWLYSTRPDGWLLVDGDGPLMSKRETRPPYLPLGDMLAASYYRDERLMGYAMDRLRARDRLTETMAFFLFADNSVPEKSWKDLPLSRYFGNPAGMLMARTGWEEGSNAGVLVAQMKIAPWRFDNHQHLDHGHFQIWYKGLLAGDSGIYQGKEGGYGSSHDVNYYKRTIAHNCVTVTDPAEKFQWGTKNGGSALVNDGGQNWAGGIGGNEIMTVESHTNQDQLYHVANVTGHGFWPRGGTPDYSWLSGDLTKAYSKKVGQYQRFFVFLNLKDASHPGALIVYDRLAVADPKFPRKWLFHAPMGLSGSPEGFAADGAWGGHLSASVLLPEPSARNIEIIGGEGKWFEVEGKNFPQGPKDSSVRSEDLENFAYRLELSAPTNTGDTRFLVAMQVMDRGTAPQVVTPVFGENHVGLALTDRCVIFPKSYGELTSLTLELPPKVRHVLVTGVAPGTWTINGEGKQVVDEEERALNLDGLKGLVKLARKM